jgi:nucleotide-binding universal stress UspA family protein
VSIASILLPLNGLAEDSIAAITALRAAKPFNAHVTGMFVHPDPAEAVPLLGMPLTGESLQIIVDTQTQLSLAASKAARRTLLAACRREDIAFVEAPGRHDATTCSFQERQGHPAKIIAEAASLADLTVLCPRAGIPESYETILDVLLKARRPVLAATEEPRESFRRIAIGWDGSACAANAMFAAMPWLELARSVEIVTIDRDPDSDLGNLDSYLKLRGISSTATNLKADRHAVHEVLIAYARRSQPDMLVIGGFGHSRVRETLFGGVTIDVLLHARVPVFLTH